ncbi:MAG: 3-isopropylmalate dehydrogenase [Saprospiraceae bacterium]|nr:MAG: 3-isopropylmalate dehydrogenase [Saprospiraceae bacterium]
MILKRKIVILPGDGIGPEVTHWGRRTLETIAECYGHLFEFEEHPIGHAAISSTGEPLPDPTLDACKQADAILLGAVGHPSYDNDPTAKVRPEQGLLKLRKSLGLFANLRPIRIFEELIDASSLKPQIIRGVDILFFRELTGGLYFGPSERRDGGSTAISTMVYTKEEVRRIARMAFAAAQRRRKVLHSVDKANVLEASRLWREVIQELTPDYPDVTVHHMYVDNAAMQLIKQPRQFDVVVTENMFGDILTDEASQIAGSLGMLPSASVGESVGLYEPVHGSAPDIAGQGLANPLATILSVALMLDIAFGLQKESRAVISAVERVLKKGFRTADIADENTPAERRIGTDVMGQKVIDEISMAVSIA